VPAVTSLNSHVCLFHLFIYNNPNSTQSLGYGLQYRRALVTFLTGATDSCIPHYVLTGYGAHLP